MSETDQPIPPPPAAPASLSNHDSRESAWRTSYEALDLVRLLSGAARVALFACKGQHLRLLAARDVDQILLDRLHAAWSRSDNPLALGRPCAHRQPSFLALPCVDGVTVTGVLLLAWGEVETHVAPASLSALTPVGRVLAAVLRRVVTAGFELPGATRERLLALVPADPRALELFVLLDEHEWNVSRAARALGVTRMTVYNRLRAAGVPRLRVPKTRPRPGGQAAPTRPVALAGQPDEVPPAPRAEPT